MILVREMLLLLQMPFFPLVSAMALSTKSRRALSPGHAHLVHAAGWIRVVHLSACGQPGCRPATTRRHSPTAGSSSTGRRVSTWWARTTSGATSTATSRADTSARTQRRTTCSARSTSSGASTASGPDARVRNWRMPVPGEPVEASGMTGATSRRPGHNRVLDARSPDSCVPP